jgi:hypothetical protein
MANMIMTEQEAIAFCQKRLSELEKAIAGIEEERKALQTLIKKEDQPHPKQSSKKKPKEDRPQYLTRRVREQIPSSEAPTATDVLKNPDSGVKGSLMQILKSSKKPKSSKELIEAIVNIEESSPYYKKIANSIRQSLRTAVKNGQIQDFREGGIITYGVAK